MNLICTARRSTYIIVAILLVLSLAYAHVLYGFGVRPDTGTCGVLTAEYLTFMQEVIV